jgi:hypothetical protein
MPEDNERQVNYTPLPEPMPGQVAQPARTISARPQQVQEREYLNTPAMPARSYDTTEFQAIQPETEAKDRVRWGAVFAGLLSALSTLALLSLLGLAIGASTYNPGDDAGNFGLGAGLWGGLSALLAFLVGGWVAARTAGVRGERNGMLNGAMVWALAIPLLLYLLSSGIGSAVRTASTVASGGVQAAAQATDNNANAPDAQANSDAIQDRADALATPENADAIADATQRAALGTLGSLLLGLGAASLGGYFGSRPLREWNIRRRIMT